MLCTLKATQDWSPLLTLFNLFKLVFTDCFDFHLSVDILNFCSSKSEVGHVGSGAWRRMEAEPQWIPASRKWRQSDVEGGRLEEELSGSAVHTRRSTEWQSRHDTSPRIRGNVAEKSFRVNASLMQSVSVVYWWFRGTSCERRPA